MEAVPPLIAATCDLSLVGPCLQPIAPLCSKVPDSMHAAAIVHVCRILKKTLVRKLRPTGHWGAVIVLLQITISPFSIHPNKQHSLMGDTHATGSLALTEVAKDEKPPGLCFIFHQCIYCRIR